MSKTAIIISGHMRTFDKCLPNLAWMVFRHYPDASFYVSTVADNDASKAELLRKRFPKARVEIDVKPSQPMLPLPVGCPPERTFRKGTPFTHEPYWISVPPQDVLRQLWQLQQGWELYAAHEDEAEIAIRCRPDLWFHHFEPPFNPLEDTAHVPSWGQFGGLNDRFAVCGHVAAYLYFNTHAFLQELWNNGCPLHPESLVKASIECRGGRIDDSLRAIFSKKAPPGKEDRPPEISAVDLLLSSMR